MLGGVGYHVAVGAHRTVITVEVGCVSKSLTLGKVAVATGLWLGAGCLLPNVTGGSGESAQSAFGIAGALKIVGT